MTLDDPLARFQGHAIIRRLIYLMSLIPFFMLLLKTNRPSMLTGRNVRLSNLLISSCFWFVLLSFWHSLVNKVMVCVCDMCVHVFQFSAMTTY